MFLCKCTCACLCGSQRNLWSAFLPTPFPFLLFPFFPFLSFYFLFLSFPLSFFFSLPLPSFPFSSSLLPSPLLPFLFLFLFSFSQWTWSLLIWLDWLINTFQGSFCFCLSSTEITGAAVLICLSVLCCCCLGYKMTWRPVWEIGMTLFRKKINCYQAYMEPEYPDLKIHGKDKNWRKSPGLEVLFSS